MKAKETKKVKIFLFAPEDATLRTLLGHYNNVRSAKYITPKDSTDYIRVRVRKRSDSVSDIAKQFAFRVCPIIEYKLGVGQGSKLVGTVRIEGAGKFEDIVKKVENLCREVWNETHKAHVADKNSPEIFLTCRVSNIVARDETPWVEVFTVQKHAVPVDVWKQAVIRLAEAVGGEAFFHEASVKEF